MKPLLKKIKPIRGFAHALYLVLNAALPFLVLLLVKVSLAWVALALILISKWRMFAVRPRFWGTNLRTNAIDIIVGLSVLVFMIEASEDWYRLGYAGLWGVWLIFLKPRVGVLSVSAQAFVGLVAGLMAIFSVWSQTSLGILVITVGLLCYFSAHHFFNSFDEPHTSLLSAIMGYFGAALTWILGHWLVFYSYIAQPALLLIALFMVLGTLYYLDHFDKLSVVIRRQVIFIGIAIVAIIWGSLVYFHWIRGGGIIV